MANRTNLRGRKIIIATTFREFNGNSNDRIQRMFLQSLKEQTYKNYVLAVTTFREKNVDTTLAEEGIKHIMFSGDAGEYKFSLTQVLQNAVSLVDKPESYIVMWTTCDVLFGPDFLEKAASTLKPMSSCTSIPHAQYLTIENYRAKRNNVYSWGGVDTIFFDADILTKSEVKGVIRDFPNKGWGLFEYFLSDVGSLFATGGMFNLWPTRIEKILNDHGANNATREFFEMSTSHNQKVYNDFRSKYHLRGDAFTSVLRYKTPIKHIAMISRFYFNITRNRIRFRSLSFASKYAPQSVKNFTKRFRK